MRLRRISAGLLIDGTGGPPLQNAAILIDAERIVAVGPEPGVPRPDGAEVFEFPSQTLMPGLVDAHSHLNLPGDGTGIDRDVARRIADQGVWVNPTLHVNRVRLWRLERLARHGQPGGRQTRRPARRGR